MYNDNNITDAIVSAAKTIRLFKRFAALLISLMLGVDLTIILYAIVAGVFQIQGHNGGLLWAVCALIAFLGSFIAHRLIERVPVVVLYSLLSAITKKRTHERNWQRVILHLMILFFVGVVGYGLMILPLRTRAMVADILAPEPQQTSLKDVTRLLADTLLRHSGPQQEQIQIILREKENAVRAAVAPDLAKLGQQGNKWAQNKIKTEQQGVAGKYDLLLSSLILTQQSKTSTIQTVANSIIKQVEADNERALERHERQRRVLMFFTGAIPFWGVPLLFLLAFLLATVALLYDQPIETNRWGGDLLSSISAPFQARG